jgi:hypothetical protein
MPEEYLNDPNSFIERPIYDGPGMRLSEREQVLKEARQEAKRYEPTFVDMVREGVTLIRQGNYKAIGNYLLKKLSGH